jgi:hypothetical protein
LAETQMDEEAQNLAEMKLDRKADFPKHWHPTGMASESRLSQAWMKRRWMKRHKTWM